MEGKSQEFTFILTGNQLFWSPPLPQNGEECKHQQRTLGLMSVLKEVEIKLALKPQKVKWTEGGMLAERR